MHFQHIAKILINLCAVITFFTHFYGAEQEAMEIALVMVFLQFLWCDFSVFNKMFDKFLQYVPMYKVKLCDAFCITFHVIFNFICINAVPFTDFLANTRQHIYNFFFFFALLLTLLFGFSLTDQQSHIQLNGYELHHKTGKYFLSYCRPKVSILRFGQYVCVFLSECRLKHR